MGGRCWQGALDLWFTLIMLVGNGFDSDGSTRVARWEMERVFTR
jgi:hypothetical protein